MFWGGGKRIGWGKCLQTQEDRNPPPSGPLATTVGRRGFLKLRPKGAFSEDPNPCPAPSGQQGSPGAGCKGLAGVQGLLLGRNTASSDHFSWSKTADLFSWGNKNKCCFFVIPSPVPSGKTRFTLLGSPSSEGWVWRNLASRWALQHRKRHGRRFLSCYKVPWNASSPREAFAAWWNSAERSPGQAGGQLGF